MTNTTKAELLALATRVEALTGPDREVDAAIWCELNGEMAVLTPDLPYYTGSQDAATGLVPDGMGFYLNRYWIAGADGPVWSAEITTGGLPDKPRRVFECFDAVAPALAICSAALRARAQQLND